MDKYVGVSPLGACAAGSSPSPRAGGGWLLQGAQSWERASSPAPA